MEVKKKMKVRSNLNSNYGMASAVVCNDSYFPFCPNSLVKPQAFSNMFVVTQAYGPHRKIQDKIGRFSINEI